MIDEASIIFRFDEMKRVLENHGCELRTQRWSNYFIVIGMPKPLPPPDQMVMGRPIESMDSLDKVEKFIDQLFGNTDWRIGNTGLYYPCLICGFPTRGQSSSGCTCGQCDLGDTDSRRLEQYKITLQEIKKLDKAGIEDVVDRYTRWLPKLSEEAKCRAEQVIQDLAEGVR